MFLIMYMYIYNYKIIAHYAKKISAGIYIEILCRA